MSSTSSSVPTGRGRPADTASPAAVRGRIPDPDGDDTLHPSHAARHGRGRAAGPWRPRRQHVGPAIGHASGALTGGYVGAMTERAAAQNHLDAHEPAGAVGGEAVRRYRVSPHDDEGVEAPSRVTAEEEVEQDEEDKERK